MMRIEDMVRGRREEERERKRRRARARGNGGFFFFYAAYSSVTLFCGRGFSYARQGKYSNLML